MSIGCSQNVNNVSQPLKECDTTDPSTRPRTKLLQGSTSTETQKLTAEKKNHNTAANQRSRQKIDRAWFGSGHGPLKVIAFFLF